MNYISATELRTKAAKIKDSLEKGESTYILHRSKIIGVIEPYQSEEKVFTLEKFKEFQKAFPPSKKRYSYKKREEIYLKHLKEKYGKSIS